MNLNYSKKSTEYRKLLEGLSQSGLQRPHLFVPPNMEMLAEDFMVAFKQKRITLVTPSVSIMYESEAPYMPQAVS